MEGEFKTYTITENGFSMTSDKVSVPACKIQATDFLHASQILSEFLTTKVKPDAIELITPIERIEFDN